jgi:hypothetical protein
LVESQGGSYLKLPLALSSTLTNRAGHSNLWVKNHPFFFFLHIFIFELTCNSLILKIIHFTMLVLSRSVCLDLERQLLIINFCHKIWHGDSFWSIL